MIFISDVAIKRARARTTLVALFLGVAWLAVACLAMTATDAGAKGSVAPTIVTRTVHPTHVIVRYRDVSVARTLRQLRRIVTITRIQPIVRIRDITRIHHRTIIVARTVESRTEAFGSAFQCGCSP